jgi:hypothetical protein
MDAMNRTLGLQLLIEMAVENPSLQLILLSPQVPQAWPKCDIDLS